MDSKRSFSFGLGKKRSSDLEASNEKPARRFSLLPASMSLKGMKGGNADQGEDMGSPVPQAGDFPQPPSSRGQGYDQGHYQEAGRPVEQQMDSYDSQDNLPARNDGHMISHQAADSSNRLLNCSTTIIHDHHNISVSSLPRQTKMRTAALASTSPIRDAKTNPINRHPGPRQ